MILTDKIITWLRHKSEKKVNVKRIFSSPAVGSDTLWSTGALCDLKDYWLFNGVFSGRPSECDVMRWRVAGNTSEDKRGQTVIQCLVNTTRHLATLNYHWLPKMMRRKLLTAWKCHLRTCIIAHYSPIIHRFAVLYSVYLTWQGGRMDVAAV